MFDLTVSGPLPFFAEIPYYVWGQVEYPLVDIETWKKDLQAIHDEA